MLIGLTLLLSVAVTGAVAGFSSGLTDLLDLGPGLTWLLHVLGPLVGLAANVVLLIRLFRLLAEPPIPRRALWQGALLGAAAFELLKQASSYLLAATKHQPAFQAFGIALILVVWINYFSRVVMYAAAWAQTSAVARAAPGGASRPRAGRGPGLLQPRGAGGRGRAAGVPPRPEGGVRRGRRGHARPGRPGAPAAGVSQPSGAPAPVRHKSHSTLVLVHRGPRDKLLCRPRLSVRSCSGAMHAPSVQVSEGRQERG